MKTISDLHEHSQTKNLLANTVSTEHVIKNVSTATPSSIIKKLKTNTERRPDKQQQIQKALKNTDYSKKSTKLPDLNSKNNIRMNSRTIFINCSLCGIVVCLRKLSNHIRITHPTKYKRMRCNICFEFKYMTKEEGKKHKLKCLIGRMCNSKKLKHSEQLQLENENQILKNQIEQIGFILKSNLNKIIDETLLNQCINIKH